MIIAAVVLILIAVCAYLFSYFLKTNQNRTSVNVNPEGLELTRNRLYLMEGKQYKLDFQPKQFENRRLYPEIEEYQDILQEYARWSSSDKAATVDQSGIISAVQPGEAVVSADLNNTKYRCEVHVLPKDTNEIPIQYKNKLFTAELYHKIEKIELRFSTEEPKEIRDPSYISGIYSFLAALDDVEPDEKIVGDESIRTGSDLLVLHLNGGEEKSVILGGGSSVCYEDTYYNCSYGEKSDYGQGTDIPWEIRKLQFF